MNSIPEGHSNAVNAVNKSTMFFRCSPCLKSWFTVSVFPDVVLFSPLKINESKPFKTILLHTFLDNLQQLFQSTLLRAYEWHLSSQLQTKQLCWFGGLSGPQSHSVFTSDHVVAVVTAVAVALDAYVPSFPSSSTLSWRALKSLHTTDRSRTVPLWTDFPTAFGIHFLFV